MRSTILVLLASTICLAAATALHAAERHSPFEGQRLLIRHGSAVSANRIVIESRRSLRFGLDSIGDPRVLGASLEVVGAGAHAAQLGPLWLEPRGWRGTGRPAGSTGYRYDDPERRITAILRGDSDKGRLRVRIGGSASGYPLDGPQQEILARLTVGTAVYCTAYVPRAQRTGEIATLVARRSEAPDLCVPSRCGNGVLDAGEACDDGNFAPRDGCSPTCRLEATTDPCHGVPIAPSERLGIELVSGGRDRPVYMASPPDDPDQLWIVEQPGRIRVVDRGALRTEALLDIVNQVSCCGERGLLSVAFEPDYTTKRRFFVNYTDRGGATIVSRFDLPAGATVAEAASERVLLRIPQDFPNHNGGQLAFGPDGFLYVGMGDGGAGGDPLERAQDPTSLLGKMLRLDVNVDEAPYYTAPPSNPRFGETLPLGLIWASGLRNPWRFAFDAGTGDLYIADVGQSAWEEINVQPAGSTGGENYGWDIFEGSACFNPQPIFPGCPAPRDGFVFPVHEYRNPAEGCSVTGGYVYRGCRMPDLHGTYFYSDYCRPWVRTFQLVDGVATRHRDRSSELSEAGAVLGAISSFGEDGRGEMYFATLNGGNVYRIVPRP